MKGRVEESLKILETKVVLIGHTGVGKTSMVYQYVHGHFRGTTTATIGAAFMKKYVIINDYKVILQIWDTAGQERFRSMGPMYYRGAHAAILVFDVSAKETLEKLGGWVDELYNHANDDIVLCLAANKSDLRAVSPDTCVKQSEEAKTATDMNARVFETSAKTGSGIEDLFTHVAKELLKAELQRKKSQAAAEEAAGSAINLTGEQNTRSGCC
mmetsp:Transcript_16880/g.32958  ORF Transcript_16880/g.32958 Transcript_16880/m.32958 type:complete len:213 (+) Transcript_16880:68-706(+)